MLDDLKDITRCAVEDTLSLVTDWRLYAGVAIFVGAYFAATHLDHGFGQEVVGLALALVAIAAGTALAILHWPEHRERSERLRQKRESRARAEE